MAYGIELAPQAERDLRALEPQTRRRIFAKLEQLKADPYPPGVETLQGTGRERFERVRVGDYRIVYQVQRARLVVLVVRIGHRREVYRRT